MSPAFWAGVEEVTESLGLSLGRTCYGPSPVLSNPPFWQNRAGRGQSWPWGTPDWQLYLASSRPSRGSVQLGRKAEERATSSRSPHSGIWRKRGTGAAWILLSPPPPMGRPLGFCCVTSGVWSLSTRPAWPLSPHWTTGPCSGLRPCVAAAHSAGQRCALTPSSGMVADGNCQP